MSCILLLIDHRQNRRLLTDWLAQHYQVLVPEVEVALQESFDLAIVDGPALDRLWSKLQARKQAEEPLMLPVLFMTSRQDLDLVTRHLWRTIDEVVLRPIEKVELQARVEVLLRARRLSVALQRQHADLETFLHAMTHELRAPLRVIKGFAEEMSARATLQDRERHGLGRIQSVATQAQGLVAALLTFGRLGRGAVRARRVSVHGLIGRCLSHMQADLQNRRAQVTVHGDDVMLQADPTLLKLALTNLLTNAFTFVAPGALPRIDLTAEVTKNVCCIKVADNGIGIAPGDRVRLFTPFMRLHGIEEYPGIGLGLATVRKAVELMGGQVGVASVPGTGSTFWIELSLAEKDDESPANR